MKKLLIIMLCMSIIIIAAVAYAVTPVGNGTANANLTIGGATFTPSNNVVISLASTTTGYSATSAHQMAASGPGYEFQIENGYNGMTKKTWTAAGSPTTPATWPEPETSPTTTVSGFLP